MSSSNQRIENREPNTLSPRDRSGNILKCFNCNSVKHLVNKCPHPKDISNMRCQKCGLLEHLAFNCSEQKGDKVEESWNGCSRLWMHKICYRRDVVE